jgi:polyphosphate kinase
MKRVMLGKIQLEVRGFVVDSCVGMSANIEAISIVDNYLEHTRIYIFGNAGQTEVLFLQQIL